MENINKFIIDNAFIIVMGLAVISIAAIVLIVIEMMKYKKLKERLDAFTQGMDGISVEKLLATFGKDIKDIHRDMILNEDRFNRLETNLSFCVQKLGYVKYNAFQDSASELSFSICLLDKFNNGVLLSVIHGREQSVSYGKMIKNGESQAPLSEEEQSAVEKAIRGM